MEIGPLSEWVTAFAEIAAVCVALFLPYAEQKRKDQKHSRNLAIILRKLVDGALETGDTNNLESYLKISYLLNNNDRDKPIFTFAQRAIEIINKQDISQEQKLAEIKTLSDYTK